MIRAHLLEMVILSLIYQPCTVKLNFQMSEQLAMLQIVLYDSFKRNVPYEPETSLLHLKQSDLQV